MHDGDLGSQLAGGTDAIILKFDQYSRSRGEMVSNLIQIGLKVGQKSWQK